MGANNEEIASRDETTEREMYGEIRKGNEEPGDLEAHDRLAVLLQQRLVLKTCLAASFLITLITSLDAPPSPGWKDHHLLEELVGCLS